MLLQYLRLKIKLKLLTFQHLESHLWFIFYFIVIAKQQNYYIYILDVPSYLSHFNLVYFSSCLIYVWIILFFHLDILFDAFTLKEL